MKIRKLHVILMLFTLPTFLLFAPQQTEAASKMPDGSEISGISISGKTSTESKSSVDEAIAIWMSGEDIAVKGDFETIYVPRNAFNFDVTATMKEFNKRTKRKFSNFFMKAKNVKVPLIVEVKKDHESTQAILSSDYINADEVIGSLEEIAKKLDNKEVDLVYINEPPLEEVAKVQVDIKDFSNNVIDKAIKQIDNQMIKSNNIFSFLETIDMPESLTNSSEDLNFLASALYKLFLQTNFDIIERHVHVNLPDYLEAGFDITINGADNKNFIVGNQNDEAYKLEINRVDNELTLSLHSMKSTISVDYEKTNSGEIEYKTLYRYSKDLNTGESEVLQEGINGKKVELSRNFYKNNELIDTVVVSKDIYTPIPEIILKSTSDTEAGTTDGDGFTDNFEMNEQATEEQIEAVNRMIDNLDWIYQLQSMQMEQEEHMENAAIVKSQIEEVKMSYNQLQDALTIYREISSEDEMEIDEKEIELLREQVDQALENLEIDILILLQLYTDVDVIDVTFEGGDE